MTRQTISYFFSLQSPWSYLGHAAFMTVARDRDVEVVWKPINLLALFPESGGLPLAKRHPFRRDYRDIELQRWRIERDVPLKLRPAFWPVDIARADQIIVALAANGADPDPFVRRAFACLWAEDGNLADEATLAGLLEAAGQEAAPYLAQARSEAAAGQYAANTEEALAAGVFGAPTYILKGEPFWGQDRIELLDKALTSGRAPFPALREK